MPRRSRSTTGRSSTAASVPTPSLVPSARSSATPVIATPSVAGPSVTPTPGPSDRHPPRASVISSATASTSNTKKGPRRSGLYTNKNWTYIDEADVPPRLSVFDAPVEVQVPEGRRPTRAAARAVVQAAQKKDKLAERHAKRKREASCAVEAFDDPQDDDVYVQTYDDPDDDDYAPQHGDDSSAEFRSDTKKDISAGDNIDDDGDDDKKEGQANRVDPGGEHEYLDIAVDVRNDDEDNNSEDMQERRPAKRRRTRCNIVRSPSPCSDSIAPSIAEAPFPDELLELSTHTAAGLLASGLSRTTATRTLGHANPNSTADDATYHVLGEVPPDIFSKMVVTNPFAAENHFPDSLRPSDLPRVPYLSRVQTIDADIADVLIKSGNPIPPYLYKTPTPCAACETLQVPCIFAPIQGVPPPSTSGTFTGLLLGDCLGCQVRARNWGHPPNCRHSMERDGSNFLARLHVLVWSTAQHRGPNGGMWFDPGADDFEDFPSDGSSYIGSCNDGEDEGDSRDGSEY